MKVVCTAHNQQLRPHTTATTNKAVSDDFYDTRYNNFALGLRIVSHSIRFNMAPPRCICKAVFGTVTALKTHVIQHNHTHQCGCGEYFATEETLKEHRKGGQDSCKSIPVKSTIVDGNLKWTKNRCYCRVCPLFFDNVDARDRHLRIRHNACPTCLQVFVNTTARDRHQKSNSHCFCFDCTEDDKTTTGKVFSSLELLARHNCADSGDEDVTYECQTCGSSYNVALDFANHIRLEEHVMKDASQEPRVAAAAMKLADVEESNLWCEQHKMHFVSLGGLNGHKTSTKHKAPLVAIQCSCGREYGFVSHFLSHLESSTCTSGMTRKKLNAIAYRYDADRRITLTEYADRVHMSCITESSTASVLPKDSASEKALSLSLESLSLDSSCIYVGRNRIHTPDNSDTESMGSTQSGVFLTPDSSDAANTDYDFIPTPSASDTASTVSDGGVILTPPASVGSTSSGEVVYTQPGSTLSDDGAVITISANTSDAGILTPDTGSLIGEQTVLQPSQSSNSGDSSEWAFLNASRMLTPASTSIDGSSVSTIRFDAVAKVWPCSKCDRTFPAEAPLRQHMNSAAHGPEIFHCPSADPDVTPAHREDRRFKSMSGLVAHIENESCHGGLDALNTIIEVIEGPMRKKFNASITPLEK